MTPREFFNACGRGEVHEEGEFSWSACDSCGSTLGGDRYAAHFIDPDGNVCHENICIDCVRKANDYECEETA